MREVEERGDVGSRGGDQGMCTEPEEAWKLHAW